MCLHVLEGSRRGRIESGIGDSENNVDWNKQSSENSFSPINQFIWELRFLQQKMSSLNL